MFKWFRTMWLTSDERKILREAKYPKAPSFPPIPDWDEGEVPEKRLKKLIYSSGNLTVIFSSGAVISKSGVDRELFDKVKECKTQEEVEDLLIEKIPAVVEEDKEEEWEETEEEKELIRKNSQIMVNHPDFVNKDGGLYMKGVDLEIPAIIAASFIEILEKFEDQEEHSTGWDDLENQYQALKMFWLKLALNALPQSREDLLVFIKKNDVKITKNGNLVLYRRIVSVGGEGSKVLTTFIAQKYYDRKKQKKSVTHPRNYLVVKKEEEYSLIKVGEPSRELIMIGNLDELYKNLDKLEENTFTAKQDNSVSIKIGAIYAIPEDKINLDNGICAAGGIHASSVDYDYSSFGDTPVVVLVNPSKTITVPRGEVAKLRTTEMFVACVNDKKRGVHFDEDALAAFDEEYHDLTLKELQEVVSTKSFEKLEVKGNKPAIQLPDVQEIIRKMLESRIVTI